MESIRAVVNTRKAEITDCYRAALKENPKLQGKVAVKLGIDMEGRGLQRGIVETDLPTSVSECILRNLRGLTFPGPFEAVWCGLSVRFFGFRGPGTVPRARGVSISVRVSVPISATAGGVSPLVRA